jgi:cytochrome P450
MAQTIVGMSSWMMHRDPIAFPDPDRFDPTRWTVKDEFSSWRERCLVSFSSGSRACIGQELAKVELYCTIAAIFRRFNNLEAWNVGPEDVVYEDYFAALHPKTARRFQVIVG